MEVSYNIILFYLKSIQFSNSDPDSCLKFLKGKVHVVMETFRFGVVSVMKTLAILVFS